MLFSKPEKGAAFVKVGLMGFAGSGKTWTACLLAKGLVDLAKKKQLPYADRPVLFVDTEGGSDYVMDDFAKWGVDLLTVKTRAFADLKQAMVEAEQHGSVLIIDSVTHFWQEFQEAYKRKKKRTRGLEFSDWAEVKGEWRRSFTEPYLNSNVHILMCGRAADDYDNYIDDAGKRQIEKAGVKMMAEKEMGFEPSLLVLMEREQDPSTNKVSRKAIIMKDRFRVLDGKELSNPTFKDFEPHVLKLNLGGLQAAVDTSRKSDDMIAPDTFDRRRTDREIVLEMITNLGTKHFSASQEDKRRKLELLEAAFGTAAWTAIEKRISLEELQSGYDKMHLQLEGKPGPYGTMDAAVDDQIPHAAPVKPKMRAVDGKLIPVEAAE